MPIQTSPPFPPQQLVIIIVLAIQNNLASLSLLLKICMARSNGNKQTKKNQESSTTWCCLFMGESRKDSYHPSLARGYPPQCQAMSGCLDLRVQAKAFTSVSRLASSKTIKCSSQRASAHAAPSPSLAPVTMAQSPYRSRKLKSWGVNQTGWSQSNLKQTAITINSDGSSSCIFVISFYSSSLVLAC